VEEDAAHLTAYVPRAAARSIVPDLRSNGQIALGFARPHDDRACQIKGEFVAARPAAARERALVERQWNAFLAELAIIGYPVQLTENWATWPVTAIRVRVTSLFSQTPGPGAGAPMS